jgi:hypothetical protein
MSFASLAAVALLSTAAAADTSAEKPAPATHVTAVASSEQADAGSAPGTGQAAQCCPAQPTDSNTAVIEARPSTPGEEGIWSAAP